jgi:hypothetical protein
MFHQGAALMMEEVLVGHILRLESVKWPGRLCQQGIADLLEYWVVHGVVEVVLEVAFLEQLHSQQGVLGVVEDSFLAVWEVLYCKVLEVQQ